MALIPLNKFLTKTTKLQAAELVSGGIVMANSGTTATVYTAPIGVTSIVLMAQVSNLTTETQYVNFIHHRNKRVLADAQGNGAQDPNIDSYLIKDFAVPSGDAGSVLSGKLIIESLDSIRAYTNSTGTLQLVLSILETANN